MNEKNKLIDCVVLKKQAEGLDYLPYPGELGEKIYRHVSKEGWGLWLNQLTMLLNDYGLRSSDDSAQRLIEEKMEEFFFSDKSLDEKTFTPPNPIDS